MPWILCQARNDGREYGITEGEEGHKKGAQTKPVPLLIKESDKI